MDGDPLSSSPSIKIFKLKGNSPNIFNTDLHASINVNNWPLSSDAPLPRITSLPCSF